MAEGAIAQLERANESLLAGRSFDAAEIEAALAERGAAVRAIAMADCASLDRPSLLRAFEDGRRIRSKLATAYRETDGQLRRLALMGSDDAGLKATPGVSAIG